ncbi:MAG TPA: hypothetical protein VIK50_06375 [Gemmatimonadaceae bacterium]
MLIWIAALVAGAAAVVIVYGLRPGSGLTLVSAALRLIAVTGLVALILNAALGAARPAPALVALDASASWLRDGDSTRFQTALKRARGEADGELLLFGDSTRVDGGTRTPADVASRVRPAVERAVAEGRPLRIYTDGELEDAEALTPLVGGSGVVVVRAEDGADVAISELRVVRATVGGDTLDVDVVLTASVRGGPPSRLTLRLGDRVLATVSVDSVGPYGERVVRTRLPVPNVTGAVLIAAALTAPGDRTVANDSLAVAVDVMPGAGAVVVSTAPDYDVRDLATVLRGTVLLPTRGFYRVAPERWREEGSLGMISEEEVRRAAREAPLLVLHGDTAMFGDPRTFARGSLLLVATPSTPAEEWYATGAPASPMATALGGSAWDSLPPLEVSPVVGTGNFEVLETRRARRLERRVAAMGWDRPKRTVLVPASGFWRWRFRGGAPAAAHSAFWGSIIDWLAAERADNRAASPADGAVREGQSIRWRRGLPTDTVVPVTLVRRGTGTSDSITVSFPAGSLFSESPPRPAGVYDITTKGGSSVLVVNPSAEVLPRRPTVVEGEIGTGEALTDAPRLRGIGWIFAIVIVSLCVEWIVRRRLGLR